MSSFEALFRWYHWAGLLKVLDEVSVAVVGPRVTAAGIGRRPGINERGEVEKALLLLRSRYVRGGRVTQ